jgi:hypothetical protein
MEPFLKFAKQFRGLIFLRAQLELGPSLPRIPL